MATTSGLVTVFEASDGATGDPAKTLWQFFVGGQPVTTANPYLAETVRLALHTNSQVHVTFDNAHGNTLSQVRVAFKYGCETRRLDTCTPDDTSV